MFGMYHDQFEFKAVISTIFFNTIWVLPLVFLGRFSGSYQISAYFYTSLIAIFEVVCLTLINQKLTSNLFFIVFETNFLEAFEFYSSYRGILIPIALLFCFTFYIIYRASLSKSTSINYSGKPVILLSILLFMMIPMLKIVKNNSANLVFNNLQDVTTFKLPYAYIEYLIEHSNIREYRKKFASELKVEVIDNNVNSNSETFVLVLGESMSPLHMSLYGYKRQTSPYLDSIQTQLHVFKNVTQAADTSIASIKKTLTLFNSSMPEEEFYKQPSIINAINSSKFKTYWISNQPPLGLHENLVTALAHDSSETVFVNRASRYTQSPSHDENILSPLESILNDNNRFRFILIHLMGSHTEYNRRYPKSFDVFDSNQGIVENGFNNSNKAKSVINDYDNSILYTDNVIYKIIQLLKAKNTPSSLLLLSDHSEDVYDFVGIHTHASTNRNIPFVLWQANQVHNKRRNDILKSTLDSKYNAENLIHTILELLSLKTKFYDQHLSLFKGRLYED